MTYRVYPLNHVDLNFHNKSDETQLKYENKKKNSKDADNWVMQVIPKRSYDDRIASQKISNTILESKRGFFHCS